MAARDRERATGGNDTGTRDDALLDRCGQITGADTAEIADGGDARREMLAEVADAAQDRGLGGPAAVGCEIGAAIEVQMDVTVDQTRA